MRLFVALVVLAVSLTHGHSIVRATSFAADEYRITPLHEAAATSAHASKIELLIEAGADPNTQDFRGRTPLNAAVNFVLEPAVILLLLEAGADSGAVALDGRNVRDHAQSNDALNETEVIQRLW